MSVDLQYPTAQVIQHLFEVSNYYQTSLEGGDKIEQVTSAKVYCEESFKESFQVELSQIGHLPTIIDLVSDWEKRAAKVNSDIQFMDRPHDNIKGVRDGLKQVERFVFDDQNKTPGSTDPIPTNPSISLLLQKLHEVFVKHVDDFNAVLATHLSESSLSCTNWSKLKELLAPYKGEVQLDEASNNASGTLQTTLQGRLISGVDEAPAFAVSSDQALFHQWTKNLVEHLGKLKEYFDKMPEIHSQNFLYGKKKKVQQTWSEFHKTLTVLLKSIDETLQFSTAAAKYTHDVATALITQIEETEAVEGVRNQNLESGVTQITAMNKSFMTNFKSFASPASVKPLEFKDLPVIASLQIPKKENGHTADLCESFNERFTTAFPHLKDAPFENLNGDSFNPFVKIYGSWSDLQACPTLGAIDSKCNKEFKDTDTKNKEDLGNIFGTTTQFLAEGSLILDTPSHDIKIVDTPEVCVGHYEETGNPTDQSKSVFDLKECVTKVNEMITDFKTQATNDIAKISEAYNNCVNSNTKTTELVENFRKTVSVLLSPEHKEQLEGVSTEVQTMIVKHLNTEIEKLQATTTELKTVAENSQKKLNHAVVNKNESISVFKSSITDGLTAITGKLEDCEKSKAAALEKVQVIDTGIEKYKETSKDIELKNHGASADHKDLFIKICTQTYMISSMSKNLAKFQFLTEKNKKNLIDGLTKVDEVKDFCLKMFDQEVKVAGGDGAGHEAGQESHEVAVFMEGEGEGETESNYVKASKKFKEQFDKVVSGVTAFYNEDFIQFQNGIGAGSKAAELYFEEIEKNIKDHQDKVASFNEATKTFIERFNNIGTEFSKIETEFHNNPTFTLGGAAKFFVNGKRLNKKHHQQNSEEPKQSSNQEIVDSTTNRRQVHVKRDHRSYDKVEVSKEVEKEGVVSISSETEAKQRKETWDRQNDAIAKITKDEAALSFDVSNKLGLSLNEFKAFLTQIVENFEAANDIKIEAGKDKKDLDEVCEDIKAWQLALTESTVDELVVVPPTFEDIEGFKMHEVTQTFLQSPSNRFAFAFKSFSDAIPETETSKTAIDNQIIGIDEAFKVLHQLPVPVGSQSLPVHVSEEKKKEEPVSSVEEKEKEVRDQAEPIDFIQLVDVSRHRY